MYIDNPIGNTPDNGDNTDNNSKTVLFEETVTTAQQGEFPVAQAELAYSQYIDADTIYVTFDGTTYTCQKRHDDEEGANYYGAPTVDGRVDFSTIPFSISSNSTNENYIATQTAGTHTVKVEAEESSGDINFDTIFNICSFNGEQQTNTRFKSAIAILNDIKIGYFNINTQDDPQYTVSFPNGTHIRLTGNISGVTGYKCVYEDADEVEHEIVLSDYQKTNNSISFTIPSAPDDAYIDDEYNVKIIHFYFVQTVN